MKTNDPWYEFYKNRMNAKYRNHIETKYEDFINFIMNSLPNKGKTPVHIHEAACGAANVSRALANKLKLNNTNFHISLSDHSQNMLELAHENYPESYKAVLDIIYDGLPKADIIFSHGVLEHFTDSKILLTIANQLASTDLVIHYVPSNRYEKPSFGDERLMSKEQWQKICSPSKIIEFNDGYDLILVWYKENITYPEFIIEYGDAYEKRIEKNTVSDTHIRYGNFNINRNNSFFLNKTAKIAYPSGDYSWAKKYRHPTAAEELIYGNT